MPLPASPSRDGVATQHPVFGAGVGLRPVHHDLVRTRRPAVPWLELHPENFMSGGALAEDLEEISAHYPVSFHAVGMSLGAAHGVDRRHLTRLARLITRHRPALVSDHLSWSTTAGTHLPDLLPVPYTKEAIALMADNIGRVQQALGREILIENPSTYLRFSHCTMSEAEFLAELVARTGCGVLLDLNNIYVSTRNAGLDPVRALHFYLDVIPAHAIGELHLAGHAVLHEDGEPHLRIDDHGSAVCGDVWDLFTQALRRLGPRPTLIEWDTNIPAFEIIAAEAALAQRMLDASQAERAYAVAG